MNKKISQKNLIYRFEQSLKKNQLIKEGDRVIVALSGGPDSVCLFDLLFRLKDKLDINLSACHYNHKIRGKESDDDQCFVERLCEERGAELKVCAYGGKKALKNEEEAREARYAFFEKILKEERGAKLAIAHNADDLSETFIFRLLRGSGPKGLKSIPYRRKKFIRPLLDFSKNDIENYLENAGIEYRKDSSNYDLKYSRNYIRHCIMPEFKKINLNASQNIKNFAELLSEQNDYIEKQVKKEFICLVREKGKCFQIDRDKFEELDVVIKSNLLLFVVSKLGYNKDISNLHIKKVIQMIEKGEGGKYLALPHSLRVEVKGGKINLS